MHNNFVTSNNVIELLFKTSILRISQYMQGFKAYLFWFTVRLLEIPYARYYYPRVLLFWEVSAAATNQERVLFKSGQYWNFTEISPQKVLIWWKLPLFY